METIGSSDSGSSGAVSLSGLSERHHPLPGLYNLRDVGGYRAASGTTRWHKLLRSDALHRLDDEGRALLAELGVAHVLDLRAEGERASAPNQLGVLPLTTHHVPLLAEAEPTRATISGLSLASIYDRIIDRHGERLVQAIRVIADAGEDEAVLVHCTAGKDRTGVVIAFALVAVGVDHDTVVDDYAMTAANLAGEWSDAMLARLTGTGRELTDEVIELVTASPAPAMDALLARVADEHGSVAGYLRANGLGDDELDRLAAGLLA